jgi:hypothetical protein
MSLSDTSRAGQTGVLSVGSLNFGTSNITISDATYIITNRGTLPYQTIGNVIVWKMIPVQSYNDIYPIYAAPTLNIPESLATTATATVALGIQTLMIPAGQNYHPGWAVNLVAKSKTAWLAGFWWNDVQCWGKVISYDVGTGALVLNILYCSLGGGTIPNTYVIGSWPWKITEVTTKYNGIENGGSGGGLPLIMTPCNWSWGGTGMCSFGMVNIMVA